MSIYEEKGIGQPRGAAARRRRSLMALPRPRSGIGAKAMVRPRRHVVRRAQCVKQGCRSSTMLAGRTRQGRPGQGQSRPQLIRRGFGDVQPNGCAGRIMRQQLAGSVRFFGAAPAARGWPSAPPTPQPDAAVGATGRRAVQPRNVDSTPLCKGPPSRMPRSGRQGQCTHGQPAWGIPCPTGCRRRGKGAAESPQQRLRT